MLRVFHHWFSGRKTAFFFAESGAIAVACAVGAAVAAKAIAGVPWLAAASSFALLACGFAVVFQFVLYLLDLYDLKVAAQDRARASKMMRACGVGVALMGLALAAVPARLFPPGALLGGGLGAVLGCLFVRAAMDKVLGKPFRVLLVGNGNRALELSRAIENEGEGAFQICSMVDPKAISVRERYTLVPAVTAGAATVAVASAGTATLDETAASFDADFVVTAADDARSNVSADALLRCRVAGRAVYDVTGFMERVLRRLPVNYLRAAELAYSDELTVTQGRMFAKRVFDVVMASILALCAAPVMLLVALLVKLDSKGPVFYRQERVGLHGKTYRLWKFRSMRTDAEKNGAVWAKANDDRVTRVGKFIRKTRMDEIPQVFNVLFGDMSFVGPRPERPVFVEQLKQQIPFYGLREAVKPGITGWAQIRYPYGASVEDGRNKLEYDLYYVKNGSLMLDLAIIFHTVRHVLLGRGAR